MEPQQTKPWYKLERGDIIRNKSTGELALVLHTWTQFFQDHSHWDSQIDYGEAGTAVRVQWIENGHEHTFRKKKLQRGWEILCK